MSREFDGYLLRTVADDPGLVTGLQTLIDRVWPRFVTESEPPRGVAQPWDWMGVYRRWPQLQYGLFDAATGALVAGGNALLLAWDGDATDLPDSGWSWAMAQGAADLVAGRPGVTGCPLSITVDPAYQGRQVAGMMIRAMRSLVAAAGGRRLLAPVRPTWKARYPLTPIATYARWMNEAGLPFDPWLRVHARLGARVVKPCAESQPLAGSVAQWEEWLDLPLPESGTYVGPGLLTLLTVDRAADEAICVEPNIWVEHPMMTSTGEGRGG